MTDEKNFGAEHKHSQIPEDARRHFQAAREEMWKSIEGMFPPGFVEHRRAARREMLLAVRSLIDAALEQADQTKAPKTPKV